MLKDDAGISGLILAWYNRHRRKLPWRAAPGARPDPYRVWLSEIMLQQTGVVTVIPYFNKFLARWPCVKDLASTDLDSVLTAWAGLGYYARARNLHACAKAVAVGNNGNFPETEAELLALPGIGPYTAAALAAIAFARPVVPLDGNIERVTARYFAIHSPLPGAKGELRKRAQGFVSHTQPGDLAQALMDLGSGICTPRNPDCNSCPLRSSCRALALGIAENLPAKAAKKNRPTRFATVFWTQREDGYLLLRRRPEKGLLGGMMEFPSSPWREEKCYADLSGYAPLAANWTPIEGFVKHVFTHFALEMKVIRAWADNDAVPSIADCRWVHPSTFGNEALPSVMRKVARHVSGSR